MMMTSCSSKERLPQDLMDMEADVRCTWTLHPQMPTKNQHLYHSEVCASPLAKDKNDTSLARSATGRRGSYRGEKVETCPRPNPSALALGSMLLVLTHQRLAAPAWNPCPGVPGLVLSWITFREVSAFIQLAAKFILSSQLYVNALCKLADMDNILLKAGRFVLSPLLRPQRSMGQIKSTTAPGLRLHEGRKDKEQSELSAKKSSVHGYFCFLLAQEVVPTRSSRCRTQQVSHQSAFRRRLMRHTSWNATDDHRSRQIIRRSTEFGEIEEVLVLASNTTKQNSQTHQTGLFHSGAVVPTTWQLFVLS